MSPLRAPFGSFEISEQVSPSDFYSFELKMEEELRNKKVHEIEILCPPELYTSNQPLITTTLVSQGYTINQAESGCCIVVDDKPLFEKMFKDKRVKFQLGQKAGLIFNTIPLTQLNNVYDFIEFFRKKLNRKLSMSGSELTHTIENLPESFFIVGVYLKDQLAAACICIRVSPSIVYTFYSAHDDAIDQISPRVFLLSHLYDLCYQNGVTLLDLGTSTLDGKPNFSLLDFKLRMGGTLTPKYRFQKLLNP